MKIVFFGNASEKIAAIRYRVLKFAEMLRAEGHTCVVCLPARLEQQERLYDNRSKGSKLLFLALVLLRRLGQIRHVIGADVATMPPSVIRGLVKHVLTDKGIESFLADWAKTGQSI